MTDPASSKPARFGPVRGALERLIAQGKIEADPAQRRLADRLDELDASLGRASVASKKSALGWLFGTRREAPEPVKGVYVHGAVGRGKTMLMDMFFRESSVAAKRRVHFHAFMGEIHERIAAHRAAVKAGETSDGDPIGPVAAQVAAQTRLLCFDEFAVTDIADAMILARLFKALFAEGIVLVATSNVAPDDLYKDGLNRGLFLPFVELLKAHVTVFRLEAATDYRMTDIGRDDLYVTPLGPDASARMDATWSALLDGARERPASLSVLGRLVAVPRAGNGAARFTFDELLARPLGAQDYLALAARFHTVMVEDVPVMDLSRRNEAKRLINLVDAFYDADRRLVLSAAAPAAELYTGPTGTEAFEFARAVSRLNEMGTETYLARSAPAPGGSGQAVATGS